MKNLKTAEEINVFDCVHLKFIQTIHSDQYFISDNWNLYKLHKRTASFIERKYQWFRSNNKWKFYQSVSICWKRYQKHRLVAHAYLWMPIDSEQCVMHMDDNPENCHVSNLVVWSMQKNMRLKYKKWINKSTIKTIRMLIDKGFSDNDILLKITTDNY